MNKKIFLLLFFLFTNPVLADEIPAEIKANFSKPKILGSANMQIFGNNIYDITLWVEEGVTNKNYQNKFALHLKYNRDIARQDLASKAVKEMTRIHNLTPKDAKDYQMQLNNILPDVKKGDTRTNFFTKENGIKLYRNGKLVGEIKDKVLAQYFVDNWLNEKAQPEEIRTKLLGLN